MLCTDVSGEFVIFYIINSCMRKKKKKKKTSLIRATCPALTSMHVFTCSTEVRTEIATCNILSYTEQDQDGREYTT